MEQRRGAERESGWRTRPGGPSAAGGQAGEAYRVLAYVKGTLDQGLWYHDPGVGKRNMLSDWVDGDFASDIDTRKSVTGYLMVLNVEDPKLSTNKQTLSL